MKKLFYICPHFSTGGMPQYVLKQVQTFGNQLDITVIEVNNYGDQYTVQRKQLPKLIQLNGNQQKLLDIIKSEEPDIIHFQELPESFLFRDVTKSIFSKNREYVILVTSHSSKTNGNSFQNIPDRIVAVNNWQKEILKKELPSVEVDIWEYPIENKIPTQEEKEMARGQLEHFSFSTTEKGKHILNVGLFTPGKNQGELFDIARKDPYNHYHFVGNQAPNFEFYWRTLMKNQPNNCYVWGERNDVDLFYKACDEFYFTSKLELNPLVIREALSYGLPVKMYKLPTYGNDYDNNELITYL